MALSLATEDDAMAPLRSPEITIPNVRLGLEELLMVIQSLDEPSRARVARALAQAEIEARFKSLLAELATKTPPEGITDAEIDLEVQAVRRASRPA